MDAPVKPQSVDQLLRSRGIFPTRQRLAIAESFLAKPQHLSAEQIYDLVSRERRRVSKATVYNTLALFVEKGLIRQIVAQANRIFYDSTTAAHHHVYNLDTGEIWDADPAKTPDPGTADLGGDLVLDSVELVYRVRSRGQGRKS